MITNGKPLDLSDPAPDAAWQIWYQDTFDRECPRRVEMEGRGLTGGLVELWVRHLFETVGVDGGRGFSRFNLWWKQVGKSITVTGAWNGMVQLRRWVFGNSQQTTKSYKGYGDKDLLMRVARVHAYLILAEQSSERILETAARCRSRYDFERQLLRLVKDASRGDPQV